MGDAAFREHLFEVAAALAEGEHRSARADVFVEFRRHAHGSARAVHQEQDVRADHLPQGPGVRYVAADAHPFLETARLDLLEQVEARLGRRSEEVDIQGRRFVHGLHGVEERSRVAPQVDGPGMNHADRRARRTRRGFSGDGREFLAVVAVRQGHEFGSKTRVGIGQRLSSGRGVGDHQIGRAEHGGFLEADAPRGEVAAPVEPAIGIPRVAEVGDPGEAVPLLEPEAQPVDRLRRPRGQQRVGPVPADRRGTRPSRARQPAGDRREASREPAFQIGDVDDGRCGRQLVHQSRVGRLPRH